MAMTHKPTRDIAWIVLRSDNVIIDVTEQVITADVFIMEVDTMTVYRVLVEDLELARVDFMLTTGITVYVGLQETPINVDSELVFNGLQFAAVAHCINLMFGVKESELL